MRAGRFAFLLLGFAVLVPGGAPRDAAAETSPPPEAVKCICRTGNACYHWLNAPVTPAWDPCSCPNCRATRDSCPKTYPADWNLACVHSSRMECFLRRHSASWRLNCSDETGTCECPGSDSAECPTCGEGGKPRDAAPIAVIKKEVAIERKLLRDEPFVVIDSPHFHLVTDIPSLKVLTQNGSKREVTMHELAHLYVQRAELAYKDFVRTFGAEIRTGRRIAVFLNRRRADSERVQTQYFGRPNAGFVYGIRGDVAPPISGGTCEAGLAASLDAQTSDDALHVMVRTAIGDVLMSLWHRDNATPSHLPMWVMVGAGHWLGRLPVPFEDKAWFIGGEGNVALDDGHDWMKRLPKELGRSDSPHIESFLGVTSLSQMYVPDHMRSWALFKLFLDEDHDRFVAMLKLIREGENQREAIRQVFGVTPDELDARWRERLTGRRKHLADEKPAAGASAGGDGLADLRSERDPRTVADRIKARKSIDDAADAAALVSLLDRDEDAVTERVVVALAKAKAAPVREYLRGEALANSKGRVKAGVVRILGLAGDQDAREDVAALLADPDSDIRAQAAMAVGRLRHAAAIPALRAVVAGHDDGAAIAAMDALASFGEAAEDEWNRVAPRLSDPHRPVRTAAAECLGSLGSMESVELLIARMETEGGRVRMDIREALKRITRDDLGNEPGNWRKWWTKEKENSPGRTPKRPPEHPTGEAANARYGEEAKFYGVEMFSKRVAFVIDVSSSMCDHITVDAGWLAGEGRGYPPSAQKYDLAVAEIAAALKTVDPRVEFGIVTFRSEVKSWRDRLVPAGSGAVADALQYLGAQHPLPLAAAGDPAKQKTNLADALRIALGIRPGTSGRPTEESADEVYVMTDGQPTAGDLVDADVLLSWFREKNRTARLRMHVITFETVDVDLTFLRALASAGGGAFVAIPTAKR